MQVATRLRGHEFDPLASTVGSDAERSGIVLSACAAVRVALWSCDCEAVKLLSSQIVRKQAKAISFQTTRTLHAAPSSTLPNSTNGWRDWQRRS